MVIMTRAHVADPELVNKAREGRLDEIRACAADCVTCVGPVSRMRGLQCCQNPAVGHEKDWRGDIPPAPKKKRVVVVGGGPGGLEAAWVAAARGHHVTLYEKASELGGQMLLARQLPTRQVRSPRLPQPHARGRPGPLHVVSHPAAVSQVRC